MPDTQDTSPATAAPSAPTDEAAARLEKLIKSTVAGTVGSITPRLARLEEMFEALMTDRSAARVDSMTAEQLRDAVRKSTEPGARAPKASDHFRQLAIEALEDFGLTGDVEPPEFAAGKQSSEHAAVYRQFYKGLVDKMKDTGRAEAERLAKEAVEKAYAEAGLDVVDASSGGAPAKGGMSWAQAQKIRKIDDISDAAYEKLVAR